MVVALFSALWAMVGDPFDPTKPEVRGAVTCEAAAGDDEKQNLAVPVDNILRARIRLVAPRWDRKWSPAAGLLFVLPGERRYTGVQVFVDRTDPRHLTIGLRKPKAAYPLPMLQIPVDQAAEVTTQFKDGIITVWAGKKSKSVQLSDAQVDGAFLMCSSGRFEISL